MQATYSDRLDPAAGLATFVAALIVGTIAAVLILVGFNITHEKQWQPPLPTRHVVILHPPDCGLIWPAGDIHWSVFSGFRPCLVE